MTDPSKPNFKSANYVKRQPQWQIVVDVVEGTLKLREKCGEYLPQFPKEPDDAYLQRVNASVLFTATEITLEGLVGMAFQKEPQLGEDVPEEISQQLENADQQGHHWRVFAKDSFRESVKEGFGFILVDMPPPLEFSSNLSGVADAGDEMAANRRPFFVFYRRDQAFNWRKEVRDGKEILQQITFEECTYEPDGMFGEVLVKRYRTFTLVDGEVVWVLRRMQDEGKETEQFITEKSGKIPFPEIPVVQILEFDKPPLLDLANFNLRHFRQLSDYDVGIHIGNIEMPWVVGLEEDGILPIGHHFLFKLQDNGSMGFASPTGACISAARQNLEDAKQDMALMGLSFVAEQNAVQKTATQTTIENVQEKSKLATMVDGLRDSLEQCLNFWAKYLGLKVENKMSVELTASEDLTLSDEEQRILSDEVFRGQQSLETFWDIKKRAGKLPKDFDPEMEKENLGTVPANA